MPRTTRFTTSSRKLLQRPRIDVRAQKLTRYTVDGPTKDVVPLQGMNKPETLVYYALRDLRINFAPQRSFLGGDILGGARTDFLLYDYRIALEYNGPFHGTTYGSARDLLRNLGLAQAGYMTRTITERDLPRLRPRILELLGRPL